MKNFYSTIFHTNLSKKNNFNTLQFNNQNSNRIYQNYSRFEFQDWIIIIRHSNNKGDFFLSHSHSDFLSYSLFYKGYELVIDPGRKDYISPFYNDIYFNSNSHNTTSVNNLPIVLNEQFYYSLPILRNCDFIINYSDNNNLTICFEIKSIPTNPDISLFKKFTFTDSSFSCNESFINNKFSKVSLVSGVNFANAYQLTPDSILIKLIEEKFEQNFLLSTINQTPTNLFSINASKSYGEEVPISRIEIAADLIQEISIGFNLKLI